MEYLFMNECYGNNQLTENTCEGLGKDELFLPNNDFGKFSISNEKINKRIFNKNYIDEYEFDIEPKEIHSNYIYKTRYSRKDAFNIKIDEYTLKRKITEKRKKNDNDNNYNMHINKRDANIDNKSFYNGTINEMNGCKKYSYINNRIMENMNENKNIFLENAWKNVIIKEKKNNVSIDPFTSYFSYPSYVLNSPKNEMRKIFKEPYRILSAPKLVDDFYLNLLDWSNKNIIGVGLYDKLCLWNNNTCKNEELFALNQIQKKKKTHKKTETKKSITSLKWNSFGNYLAVGLSNGVVEIWEVEKGIKIRKYKNHKLRVGVLCWYCDTLTSGSRDNKIINCDLRIKENSYAQLEKHKSEICGLEWDSSGKQLASGSNDNTIYIWENRTNNSVLHFTKHKAAVKAISWCPYKNNFLISGGGSADKKIFLWNTSTGKCVNEINTNSQVSNIIWSKNTQEFISTHSYSQNQIIIWSYPQLKKISILTGHKLRVLYASLSSDGTSIVSGSPDETLRFWNIFPSSGSYSPYPPYYNCYEMIR